jgi:hypothetical protein
MPMIRLAMPPGLAPGAPDAGVVLPLAFSPEPRTVPLVPDLPANRPAAFLIMLPTFM